jgi:hypothetical protein
MELIVYLVIVSKAKIIFMPEKYVMKAYVCRAGKIPYILNIELHESE